MNNVALIIIYNHQYNKNIKRIEKIYENRFSNIYHLVPFYNGNQENVIPVYENSYFFQGYISQGLKKYFKKTFKHYFFIADDLILNPKINENNYNNIFLLDNNTSFLPEFVQFHETNKWWARVNDAYKYKINNINGIEADKQLPEYDIALNKFKDKGLEIKPLKFNQIWALPTTLMKLLQKYNDKTYFIRKIINIFTNKKYNLSYPMIGSYSDICIIDSNAIKNFCHYCGVFASTKLFVEVALPTALVLSAKRITTEKEMKINGRALWDNDDYKILDKYNKNLKSLLNNFPKNHIYLHPIKLSKWK